LIVGTMNENVDFILPQGKIQQAQPDQFCCKVYGVKGAGIVSLPILWTPCFFLISTSLYERYQDVVESVRSSLFDQILTIEERFHLEAALKEVMPSENDFVIVRSSAADESLAHRGRYKSLTCMATVEDLASVVGKVFASCPVEMGTAMGIIVQRYIGTCRSSGHLSNERRVSKRISSWVCEFDAVSGVGAPWVFRFSSSGVEPARTDAPLMCDDKGCLIQILKQVAAWSHSRKLHLHFEWIWDGSRLWIVQADYSSDIRCKPPFASRHKSINVSKPRSVSTLVSERDIPRGIWSKLDCVKIFRECGLPTTDLWILHDKKLLSEFDKGECPARVIRDLESLLGAPIVIRMDVAQQNDPAGFMLPRTDTISNIEMAEKFLISATKQVPKKSVTEGKLCFIIHRFIPSRSSAFGFADPQKRRVRIDGIWGLPEGLNFYSHDSYDLANDGIGKVLEYIRPKQEYLDVDGTGKWVPRLLGPPFDWKSSLMHDELRQIAKGTFAIANAINARVQVMWFVGIPDGLGHPPCIPWYYTTQELPESLVADKRSLVQKEPLIRRREDLEILRCEVEDSQSISRIRLRPVPELLRSKEFIEDVAELAKRRSVSVVIEGSVLSHAYYLLRNCGVDVICSDLFAPEFKPKEFNKLVRDLIPVKIRSRGEKAKVLRLTGNKLASVLKAKAVEEALELFWSDSIEQSKEEMVDLLEVIRALSHYAGLLNGDLEKLAEKKRGKRGSFDEGLVLRETVEIPLIKAVPATPNLFEDLEFDQERKGELKSHFVEKVNIGPTPQLEGPCLIIPLVPPHPEHRHFSHSFTLKSANVSVNVRFREKDVVIEVNPHIEKTSPSDPRQLKLFDF